MIKRLLFNELRNHLQRREITFIVGPRQAGKTTLMYLLKDYIEKKGFKTVFLNLDIEADKQFFNSQEQLLRKIRLEVGESGYVFIDEIQRKENAGLFLKGLYDMNLPYKFIVSGSGSVELKEKIHESLSGRKQIFELSTISWTEFVNYKTEYKYETKLDEFFSIDNIRTEELFFEYLNFGGYPKVVLEERIEEKRKMFAELYQSYLERDIVDLLGIHKGESFTSLVRLMAATIGQMVNISEISSTIGINIVTVNNYLWYMQKTFLLSKLTPFFKNIRKEISKSPVFYFYDIGMRNYAHSIFGATIPNSEKGFLFQNFIYNILKEKISNTSIQAHYWRTSNKAEVDFVLDKGTEIIPIEVKYQKLTQPAISRSLHSFISRYNPKVAIIVHLGNSIQKKVENTDIQFIPYYKLLYQKTFLK